MNCFAVSELRPQKCPAPGPCIRRLDPLRRRGAAGLSRSHRAGCPAPFAGPALRLLASIDNTYSLPKRACLAPAEGGGGLLVGTLGAGLRAGARPGRATNRSFRPEGTSSGSPTVPIGSPGCEEQPSTWATNVARWASCHGRCLRA